MDNIMAQLGAQSLSDLSSDMLVDLNRRANL